MAELDDVLARVGLVPGRQPLAGLATEPVAGPADSQGDEPGSQGEPGSQSDQPGSQSDQPGSLGDQPAVQR
jgi:hypothetical protein